MEWRSLFLFLLTFFGLTPNIASQVRINLFTQIHEIIFHGNGGYDWHTVYNMPIWLRKFTFHKLQEYYKQTDDNKSSDNVSKSIEAMKSAGSVAKNPITKATPLANYVTKASKK